MKNERKLTFGARRALAIIGSFETKLFKESQRLDADPKALRKEDRLILDAVDGERSVREVTAAVGLDYEKGLHSIAWLMLTGFIYSTDKVEKLLSEQADRLAFFVELFSDVQHGLRFWQDEIVQATKRNPALGKFSSRIVWEDLTPKLATLIPSPAELKEYFLHLFVALYDKAEEIFGAEAVLAKRILLDVRPWL